MLGCFKHQLLACSASQIGKIYFFEDASARYVNIWHVAKFKFGECDDILEICPVGDIAFEKSNLLGTLVRLVDKGVGLWRKSNVSDDDFVVLGRGQPGKC